MATEISYRGHEIRASRETSLGGDRLLYYSVIRESDGYICVDAFEGGDDTERNMIAMLRKDVDEALAADDPWDERYEREARTMSGTADARTVETGEAMTIEDCIIFAADEGAIEPHEAVVLRAELATLRPLRAAVLRYGRAVQQVRARGGSIVDAVGYDEWCEALEALEALALALAAEEGQG